MKDTSTRKKEKRREIVAAYTYHGQHNMDRWGMLPDASIYIVRTSIAMDGTCSLNARASIDGATGKLTKFSQRCDSTVDSRSALVKGVVASRYVNEKYTSFFFADTP